MKRPKIVAMSISGIAAAVAVGYFGVQVVGKNVMYAISGGTIGLGAGTYCIQILEKKKTRLT
jgi:hypothetical protein